MSPESFWGFREMGPSTNARWDNMVGNKCVVSEWKENFRLSQPNRLFLAAISFLLLRQPIAC